MTPFKVGVTRDLITKSGKPCFNSAAFEELKANPAIEWEWLGEDIPEITSDIMARYDALHINLPRVSAAAFSGPKQRVRIIARNGVGYDTVDVAAATKAGVIVTNTPLAVRRPVAVATLTLLFALAGRLFDKDAIVRANRWNDRVEYMGTGLTTRTLGLIGAGSIGQEIIRLAGPFFKEIIAADPYADPRAIEAIGGRIEPFDTVMQTADFVVVCCLLTPDTHHLINARALSLMKPTACYINVGRGPIHDEAALVEALQTGRIAAAGLDVTEVEPIPATSPLLTMKNTIITAHALCWTDECFEDIARSALRSIADVSLGRKPKHMVNPAVGAALSG